MSFSWKQFGWLSAAVILTYMAVVALGFFMPLQNDEISGLYLNHRAMLDDKTVITLIPQCGKKYFSYSLPLLWYLPAFASYLTYGQFDSPIWVRVAGMTQFLIWLSLWAAIAMKLFAVPTRRWWAALAVILGFFGWDAFPLVFLVSRPEQILLIAIGTAVTMGLYREELSRNRMIRIFSMFWMFFIILCVHSAHPKAVAILPLELVMYAAFLERAWRNRAVTVLGLIAITGIAAQSYDMEFWRYQCPDFAEGKKFFLATYLPLSVLWHSPGTFLLSAVKNVFSSAIVDFFLELYFHVGHIWILLSLAPLSVFTEGLIRVLDIAAWIFHLGFLVVAYWICVRCGMSYMRREEDARRRSGLILLGLGALLLFIGALLVLMTEGVFYAVILMIPLVGLAAFFAVKLKYPEPWKHRLFKPFVVFLLAGALLNQSLLLYRYAGFVSSTDPAAYAALNLNPMALSTTFGYEEKRRAVLELAQQCHIKTDHDTRHLVLDEMTYFPFRKTYQPLFFVDTTWVCCHSGGSDPGKLGSPWFDLHGYIELLTSYDSDGVIAQCNLFPESLRALSIEHSGFCCIPKSRLQTPVHPAGSR